MNKIAKQLEIVLMLNTHFLSRECSERNGPEDGMNRFTAKEKLVEACWNGLLDNMFPEMFKPADGGKKLFLWQVKEASSFLGLEWAESDGTRDLYMSIDPYCFLPIQYFS
jgi:hypothetical protein